MIQLRRIGDVILTTPAVAALKKRYPDAAIDFLVEAPGAEALKGNPHIREVLVYDGSFSWFFRLRARRYDWVIDYLGNPRSAFLTALSGAAVKAGPGHVFHRWAYNHKLMQSNTTRYGAQEKIVVLQKLDVPGDSDFMPRVYLAGGRPHRDNVVGLVPASRKATRRWPAASYAALGRLLRDRFGARIRVFWGPGEKPLAEEVVRGIGSGAEATPETRDLSDAAVLMAQCRLVVTNCNGPKHLAVALGVPTVTIHGSSDPKSWNPPRPDHPVVRRDELHCIGCQLNECPYALECMTGLAPETVFAACEKLWAGAGARA